MNERRPTPRRQGDPSERLADLGADRNLDPGQIPIAVAARRHVADDPVRRAATLRRDDVVVRVEVLPERRDAGEVVDREPPTDSGDGQLLATFDGRRSELLGRDWILSHRLDQGQAVEGASVAYVRRRDTELPDERARERLV